MDSMLFGSRLEKKVASAIAPSMTYKGSDVPKLPRPRKLILGLEPGREMTVTPGTVPCTADNTLLCTRSLISSVLTEATEPVRFTFFCVPYPTTTTSSNTSVSSFNVILKGCPSHLMVCVP